MVKYTRQEAKAIRQSLPLKADNVWPHLLKTITNQIYEATTPEIISLGPQLYQGEARRRLQTLLDALDSTRKAYTEVGEHLQWGIDEALHQVPFVRDSYSDERRITVRCVLSSDQFPLALDAVRQATLQTAEVISGPKTGVPKNDVMREAVHKLLNIFEVATGVHPKVYSAPYSKDGYAGNAYAYLVACLVPWRLLPRKQLGSAILVAYRDWKRSK